jgi:hypothetical protein
LLKRGSLLNGALNDTPQLRRVVGTQVLRKTEAVLVARSGQSLKKVAWFVLAHG